MVKPTKPDAKMKMLKFWKYNDLVLMPGMVITVPADVADQWEKLGIAVNITWLKWHEKS